MSGTERGSRFASERSHRREGCGEGTAASERFPPRWGRRGASPAQNKPVPCEQRGGGGASCLRPRLRNSRAPRLCARSIPRISLSPPPALPCPGSGVRGEAGTVEEAGRVVPARTSASKTAAATTQRRRAAQRNRRTPHASRWPWVLGALELLALLAAALVGVAAVLGRAAGQFAGADTWHSLVPFAGSVLVLVLAGAAAVARLDPPAPSDRGARVVAPAMLALGIAIGAAWFVRQPSFHDELSSLRASVGGRGSGRARHGRRIRCTPPIGAPIRRSSMQVLERARRVRADGARSGGGVRRRSRGARWASAPPSRPSIRATAATAGAASSRSPRRRKWRSRMAQSAARRRRVSIRSTNDTTPIVAAATLQHYLAGVHGDSSSACSPTTSARATAGCCSIMKQYGARDFVTIQPYLQNLPRDYPIRVLSAALAFRLLAHRGETAALRGGRQRAAHPAASAFPASVQGPSSTPPATTSAPQRRDVDRVSGREFARDQGRPVGCTGT